MRYLGAFLIILLILVFSSCQYDDQNTSSVNENTSNMNMGSIPFNKDFFNTITICDEEPTSNCGGCLRWEPGSLDFGVITLGKSKTLLVAIVTHPGIVDHFFDYICQYGFQYNDEINLSGNIPAPGQRVYGNQRFEMELTYTPLHGTGLRSGSLWLQYHQWVHGVPPGGQYPTWACELPITARVLTGGGGSGVIGQ